VSDWSKENTFVRLIFVLLVTRKIKVFWYANFVLIVTIRTVFLKDLRLLEKVLFFVVLIENFLELSSLLRKKWMSKKQRLKRKK
jgi:hypothetical protein